LLLPEAFFQPKIHQIAFGGRALPRPTGGAYSAPPDLLAGLRERTSKGRDGKGVEGGKKKEGREGWELEVEGSGRGVRGRGRGREGRGSPLLWILDTPWAI